MEFKVTLKQQLSHLSSAMFKILLMIVAYLFLFGFTQPYIGFLYLFLFIFIFDIFPALIVHWQYWRQNASAVLKIDNFHKELSYFTEERETLSKSFDDIVNCYHVTSYGGGRWLAGWYSFGEYHHYKIVFSDDSYVVATSLLIKELDMVFDKLVSIKKKDKFKFVAFIDSKLAYD